MTSAGNLFPPLLITLLLLGQQAVAGVDGSLPPKPAPLSKTQLKQLYEQGQQQCAHNCATPFGQALGSNRGVVAYSNCRSECIRPEYSFLNLKTGEISLHKQDPKNPEQKYIGVIYQCVEYARRWWMTQLGIRFGSVDSAWEVLYLEKGQFVGRDATFELDRFINGQAHQPPAVGDLLVYAPDRSRNHWLHGHVAVVVESHPQAGWLAVAEENYDNRPWPKGQQYARKLQLLQTGPYWQVLDLPPGQIHGPDAGSISGWVRPQIQTDTKPKPHL